MKPLWLVAVISAFAVVGCKKKEVTPGQPTNAAVSGANSPGRQAGVVTIDAPPPPPARSSLNLEPRTLNPRFRF